MYPLLDFLFFIIYNIMHITYEVIVVKRYFHILVLLTCLLASAPASAKVNFESQTFTQYFGTASILLVYDDFSAPGALVRWNGLCQAVDAELRAIDEAVSASIETSDVARFNQLSCGESLAVSPVTAALIEAAQEYYLLTDGLYDPSVAMLTDLWGFSPRFTSYAGPQTAYDRARNADGSFSLPDEKYIKAFCHLADFSRIELTGDEEHGYALHKNIPDITVDGVTYCARIDLGSIAKGYAVDRVLALMREAGYEYGYFNCGRSSMGFLKSNSKRSQQEGSVDYLLDIAKPRPGGNDDASFLRIPLHDASTSTSGDVDHCYMVDGVIYCHIINPKTGWPMNTPASADTQSGIALATVIGESAMEADILSTALCLMGTEKAPAFFSERLEGEYDMVLTMYDEEMNLSYITSLDRSAFHLLDDAYLQSD